MTNNAESDPSSAPDAGNQKPPAAREIVVEILFTGLIALVLLYWNPFNLWSRFDDGGRAVLQSVFSVEYSHERPKTAVVLVGDDFLEQWDYSWPLPLEGHEAILESIAEGRPRAIFIDFMFIDRRESDASIEQFAGTIGAIAEHTQVYLALAPGRIEEGAVLPELLALARRHPNVHLVSVEIDHTSRERGLYPLAAGDDRQQAALVMARHNAPVAVEDLERRRLQAMDIVWPLPPPASNCQAQEIERECRSISSSWHVRAMRLALSGLIPVDAPQWGFPETYRVRTYPISTLRASAVTQRLDDDRLREAFVFYGADFDFTSNDRVTTPNYGVSDTPFLPGVYAHAVAFDNIVTLGGAHVIGGDPPLGLRQQDFVAFVLVLVIGVAGLLWLLGLQLYRRKDWKGFSYVANAAKTYSFWITPAFVLVTVGVFLFLHITPGFWLTVLALAMLRSTPPLNAVKARSIVALVSGAPGRAR